MIAAATANAVIARIINGWDPASLSNGMHLGYARRASTLPKSALCRINVVAERRMAPASLSGEGYVRSVTAKASGQWPSR